MMTRTTQKMTQDCSSQKNNYTISDIYRSYVNDIIGGKSRRMNIVLFKSILYDYLKYESDRIINRAYLFTPPYSIGSIFVGKRKIKSYSRKNLRVDFAATRELKKTILHTNEHSSGYNYMFRWRKVMARCININMYELVMSRTNKRNLAHSIKNKTTDYLEY